MHLSIGPQHPSTHGVLRLLVQLQDEQIRSLQVESGYLHRGTEKLVTFNYDALPYFDRLDYISNGSMELLYLQGLETGLGLPIRNVWKRILLMEMYRINNHLMAALSLSMDLGLSTPFLWILEARERWLGIMEHLSGSRMHCAALYYVPTLSWLQQAALWLRSIRFDLPIALGRLKGIGILGSGNDLSGPIIRAAGVPLDLRISTYSHLITYLGTHGDSLDRLIVRLNEVKHSRYLCLKSL